MDRRLGRAGRGAVWLHRAGDEPSLRRPPLAAGRQHRYRTRRAAGACAGTQLGRSAVDVAAADARHSTRSRSARAHRAARPKHAPEQWNLSGGNARDSWALQYTPGAATAEVKHNRQTWLAAFNRLHKAVGGGLAWTLLADSFAIGMLLLGLSGMWMWARGRNARQMVVSVLGCRCWCCWRCWAGAAVARAAVLALLQPDQQRFAGAVEHVPQARCRRPAATRCRRRPDRGRPGVVGEARLAGEQVHRPDRAGFGEHHHRPDQRPMPELRLDRVAPPHQVEILGRAVEQFAGDGALAGEAQPVVRRLQFVDLAIVEAQAQAVAGQQHQFAIDAGERRERRVLLDLGDRQPPVPVAGDRGRWAWISRVQPSPLRQRSRRYSLAGITHERLRMRRARVHGASLAARCAQACFEPAARKRRPATHPVRPGDATSL